MKIEKEYKYNNNDTFNGRYYKVIFTIKDENDIVKSVFYDEDKLSNNSEYVESTNICDEDFLKKHKIEYEVNENKLNNTIDVIPTGLINFFNMHYTNSEFCIGTKNKKEFQKMDNIINNIEKAIKIKYEVFKFDDKCKKNKIETIELD